MKKNSWIILRIDFFCLSLLYINNKTALADNYEEIYHHQHRGNPAVYKGYS
jgi:hypothetical protein